MMEKRVLIVEDEGIVAMAINDTLKKMGYTVTGICSTGEDAIVTAAKTVPDVVLMDIHLKGEVDGIEAADKINKLYGIPVIYLTAYADDETIRRALSTGSYGYLVKPFNARELFSNIELTIYKHRVKMRIGSDTENLEGPLSTLPEAAVLVDARQAILYMNLPAEQMTGYNLRDIQGKNFFSVLGLNPSTTEEPCSLALEKIKGYTSIRPIPSVAVITTRGGKARRVCIRTNIIANSDGTIGKILLVMKPHTPDIT
ncbi:ATP-binding response regulator [Methanolinea mesophila]|uniref:ATP-binding response regulator n=1 Tax=Methanolinea mesophila TaxID=547055 RepID=UPI001AE57B75|nr:response regulator [Methanolinea mesophila]